ncbi:MAG: NAD(P)-dependent oxidoreductase, partial [Chitinophagaceae bacterium]
MTEDKKDNINLGSPTGGQGAVFVTGGTGFLGSYIIQNLVAKGHTVRALRRTTSQLPFFIPAS